MKELLDRFGRTFAEQAGILAGSRGRPGRGHYRRRDEASGDPQRIRELLTEFKGMGPVGSDIVLREVQAVWPQVAPYLDARVVRGAEQVGLPSTARELSRLVESPGAVARLPCALVRVSRDPGAVEKLRGQVSKR